MLYTIQTHADSGNWTTPAGTASLFHVWSKLAAAGVLDDWADKVGRYNDRSCASALVWHGHLDDVTDCYPDWQLTIGSRGGINWSPA